jgi:hypothetical protein
VRKKNALCPVLLLELTPKEWLSGKNRSLDKMSLDPAKRENGDKPIVVVCIIIIIFLKTSIYINYLLEKKIRILQLPFIFVLYHISSTSSSFFPFSLYKFLHHAYNSYNINYELA